MYFAVKRADPNLIGYWKMDEGKGNAFADCTGHGYDLVAGGLLSGKSTFVLISNNYVKRSIRYE